MKDTKIALVLGATGGIGGAVAKKLVERGWSIRALNRNAAAAVRQRGIEWIQGDALNAADTRAAAEGASLIVHAVNPPGYRDWAKLVLPMLDNTIAAAAATGARIVLPGTVYNFGPDAFPDLREDSPQNPRTRKGAIRVEMEKRLQSAAARGTAAIIVRAGDFFGPGATANSWFSQIVTPGKPVTRLKNPSSEGVGHQWAYLPDVAQTMVELVDRAENLPTFAVYHMDGFWDHDGTQLVEAIKRVSGGQARIGAFPWWLVPLASPFVTVMSEVMEMRYLWKVPLRMSNKKLVAELGREPQTPIDEAVHASLLALGCMPNASQERMVETLRQSG